MANFTRDEPDGNDQEQQTLHIDSFHSDVIKWFTMRETFRQVTQKLWATNTWVLDKLFIY